MEPFQMLIDPQSKAPAVSNPFPEMHWTPEMISRFWDWQSQYPEVYFTYLFGREIAYAVRDYLRGRQRVLDFGCGVGYLLPHLCRYAPKVYGADLSTQSIARTNERLAGTSGFEGAFLISELQQRESGFDAVLVVEVVEHLYDEDLDAALVAIRGMLNPGGIAIFTTPNDENREANMILCPATGQVFHRWQHVRSWSAASLSKRLRERGFQVLQVIETNFSIRQARTPVEYLKKVVKRLAFGDPGKPHLICVARTSDAVRSG
jgi:2-polyprenyl-3-methyl-5-hydroxy-6-metoxy-1,4-benzoquinol methylase